MKNLFTCLLLGTCLSTVMGLGVLFIYAVEKVKENAERSGDAHIQVNLALLSYHQAHGRFPPAVIRDREGKPLYSWRVVVLPYVDSGPLYQEFHLEEPWDSPHHLTLVPKMPPLYAAPGRKAQIVRPHHTTCHVFVGKGAAFEGTKGLNLRDDFPDGLANTILVVDTGKPVPWSKPEDLPYDPDQPLPDLRGHFHDGFWACTANNKRVWVRHDLREETLRALITRNGKDQPGADWRP